MPSFEERANDFVATAEKLARLKDFNNEAEILKRAKAKLLKNGYDNWNGGTDLYTLVLELPIEFYAAIDDHQNTYEKNIIEKINQVTKLEFGHAITEIVISPHLITNDSASNSIDDESSSIPSFWAPGYFRLFISHLAANKDFAHGLKEALLQYQIVAFVAHDDIEPAKEWQGEIESALRTMDGLTALIVPDFIHSKWCDQEVGVALGRSKLIIPLRFGADPYGFMGKYQGIQATGSDVTFQSLAERIFDTLVKNELSSQRMAEALVTRVIESESFKQAKDNSFLLEKIPKLNESQVVQLLQAIDHNSQIRESFGVPERIRRIIAEKSK